MPNIWKLLGVLVGTSFLLLGTNTQAETLNYNQNFGGWTSYGNYESTDYRLLENNTSTFSGAQTYDVSTQGGVTTSWQLESFNTGQIRLYNIGSSSSPNRVLLLDDSNATTSSYSLNEAILKFDGSFASLTNLKLSFTEYNFDNEWNTSGGSQHTLNNHTNQDAVFVRANSGPNTDWIKVTNLEQYDSTSHVYTNLDLSAALSSLAGATANLSAGFQIKFQQYDNQEHPNNDGRKFDSINVTGNYTVPGSGDNNLVPEPSSWALFGVGLVAMYGYRRRQKANVKA